MHFEELEQRTLFAGANETMEVAAIESDFAIPAPIFIGAEFSSDFPASELNVIAGEILEATGVLIDTYMVEPSVAAYDAIADKAQDYYENPSHLAGDALYAAGKSLEYLGAAAEYVGQSMEGLGEGLSEYSEPVRHAGRMLMMGSVFHSYMYDPTLTSMYVGGTAGAVIWGAAKMMPYTGTISSFVGSAVETLGSYTGSLGSFAADYGSSLTA